ncbi:MAG: hypothetical protein ACI959_000619 [Limisphaerales bacterium]|jgi:hypothetical protein
MRMNFTKNITTGYGLIIVFSLMTSLVFTQSAFAQNTKAQTPNFTEIEPLSPVQIDPKKLSTDWNPVMMHLEAPAPGGTSYRSFLRDEKAKRENFVPTGDFNFERAAELPAPELLRNFEGNPYNNSVPNDNDVAISNSGNVISVINSTIWFYDSDGNELDHMSLASFVDTLGIPAGKFDPKVQYDPIEDKFVIVFLGGFTSSDTHVFVCFSTSDNPTDPWNVYRIPGNPFMNTTWTDYPMMALTEDEIFITINLLREGEPWQTGFEQTLIWHMDKIDGYNGDELSGGYWDNINFGSKPIRNLRPVQGGSTLYGPDLWLVSNRNFDLSNDTVFLVHVTGKWDEPGVTAEVDFLTANIPYGVPPEARQDTQFTFIDTLYHIFDTNDGRILGAFYEGDQIQFVSCTHDPATGRAAIYHGRISDVSTSPELLTAILGDDSPDEMDFGYPNISFVGEEPSEIRSIISFEFTGPGRNAGLAAVYTNYNSYSDMVVLKEGETYVNILSGVYERWGDYTGSQRKYDEPGTVWVSGNFSKTVANVPFPGSTCKCNATWLAELRTSEEVSTGLTDIEGDIDLLNVYPNPTTDLFTLDFEVTETQLVKVRIFDNNGRLVRHLMDGKAKVGLNRLSFSLAPLSAGVYTLVIESNNKSLKTSQVVKF